MLLSGLFISASSVAQVSTPLAPSKSQSLLPNIKQSSRDTNTNASLFHNAGSPANTLQTTSGGLGAKTQADPSNIFFGVGALSKITTGIDNSAFGDAALNANTKGSFNTAVGGYALLDNDTGASNTAIGYGALTVNVANYNTAIGADVLDFNTIGTENTGCGTSALFDNSTGNNNTAFGYSAMGFNSTGSGNTATGYSALSENKTGNNNTAIGYNANVYYATLTNATAIGANATVSISNALVLGNNANVGIGTSSPSQALEVGSSGSILLTNTNGTAGKIEFQGSGSGMTTFAAGAQGTADISYTLPIAQGAAGTVLKNDGAGNLSWGTAAGEGLSGSGTKDYFAIWNATGASLANSNVSYDGTTFAVFNAQQVYVGNNAVIPTNMTGVFLATSTGAYLSTTGIWHNPSDRNLKTNLSPVDADWLLARVAALPMAEWNYKSEDARTLHIGPMAQDFHNAFGLDGSDTTHISEIDEGGVALAAIQALEKRTEELNAANEKLVQKNETLTARILKLESLMQTLIEQKESAK